MIIPRQTPPLLFRTVIALGYFFVCCCFFYYLVIRYALKIILVLFQTNFGYVLGEIYFKNVIDRRTQFQEIW